MIDLTNFPQDPNNPDRVEGWGVYHEKTCDLFGFYTTEEEATRAQQRAGEGYAVAFGSDTLTAEEFITGRSQVSG
jgi:hypothetical protein